jgi:hypothetical protein
LIAVELLLELIGDGFPFTEQGQTINFLLFQKQSEPGIGSGFEEVLQLIVAFRDGSVLFGFEGMKKLFVFGGGGNVFEHGRKEGVTGDFLIEID